jgi:hypothetical protein
MRPARPKTKAGAGACFCCGREVVWRKTEGGALSTFCQHCDLQVYAKDGTEAERMIMAKIGATAPAPDKAPEPQPAPAAKPAAPAAPKAKPAGVFGLGGF